MNKSITRTGIVGTLAFLSVFTAGYAAGGSQFATKVNRGLANAFHSVGQNLFGSAAFAVFIPGDPVTPANPLRLDFAENIRILVALSVFIPGNPVIPNDLCQTYLRIELTGGAAVLKYDPNTAPEGFSTDLVAADLSAFTPNTTQCPAPAPPT